jgi:hypothetical protein
VIETGTKIQININITIDFQENRVFGSIPSRMFEKSLYTFMDIHREVKGQNL